MIDICNLLKLSGLDFTKRIKFIRHQDPRVDIDALIKRGYFEIYQAHQAKPVFNCDYIVSFIACGGKRSKLVGVYEVIDWVALKKEDLVHSDPIISDIIQFAEFKYKLIKDNRFSDLENRAIINWGDSTRAWHQWASSREIVEILPNGHIKEWPGYVEFTLDWTELELLINNIDSNRDWKIMLSRVAGIYLITDKISGKQYVGSAYGEEGIWGRWQHYIKSKHGDNIQLIELIALNDFRHKEFTFSILHTLPRTMPFNEVIRYEGIFKEKLGTRAVGLNSN